MRLAEDSAEVTQDLTQSQAFGMQMNAKMYSILTDRLYTDKPGAVIRELSANAYDAHKSVGKEDIPFTIKVPTLLDPTFYIRDYGTGIDPDQFAEIYTNVGQSTKDDDNEAIGAYGLGSKTPFAMVDAYTVEDYYQGSLTVFQCFKDKGLPQVSRLGSHATDECDGLKISFPISGHYQGDFIDAINKQLRNFYTLPEILGTKMVWPDRAVIEDGWSAMKGSRVGLEIVVGGITYPAEFGNLVGWSDYRALRSMRIVIEAPIGSIDIPPSRESIEYTDRTKEYLVKRIVQVDEGYKQRAIEHFKQCKNAVEAAQSLDTYKHYITDHTTFNVGGQEFFMNTHMIKDDDLRGSLPLYKIQNNARIKSEVALNYHRNGVLNGGEIYINDVGSRAWAIMKDERSLPGHQAFVSKGFTKKNDKDKHVSATRYAAAVLGLKVKMLSEFVKVPEVDLKDPNRTIKIPDQIFKIECRPNGSLFMANHVSALPTEGYYMDLTRNEITTKYARTLFKYLPEDAEVYGLRSKARSKVSSVPALLHIDTLVPKMLEDKKKLYMQERKIKTRKDLFGRSDLSMRVCQRSSDPFDDRDLRTVQILGTELSNKHESSVFTLEYIHHYEPEWKPEWIYHPQHALISSVEEVREYYAPLTHNIQYSHHSSAKVIDTLNKLLHHLREPK